MLRVDLDRLAIAARWDATQGGADPARLARTAADPRFPGALLPAVDPRGEIYWYGVATSSTEWRVLQPMLLAFAGPTVTSFRGRGDRLSDAVPVEQFLIAAGATIGARLVPGAGCSPLVERALARLVQGVLSRPRIAETGIVSTARLLSRFEMSLVAGHREGAETIISTLRTEMRIDALNLHFLEVRLLSTFRAWRELTAKDWFSDLALARKPSAVASAMVDAMWYSELQLLEGDESALRTRYLDVRRLLSPLVAQITPGHSAIADRLRHLEPSTIERSLLGGPAAQTALVAAVEAPSIERALRAKAALEGLGVGDRETLLHSGAGRTAAKELDAATPVTPANWHEWLQALSQPRFENCMTAARDLVVESPVAQLSTSAAAASIAEAIVQIAVEHNLARERLTDCAPLLVRWLKEDPGYPRRALKTVYDAIFQLLTLIDYRGAAERDAAADLLDAILRTGCDRREYAQLVRDLSLIVDSGAGRSSVYWLIDVAAILLESPAPDVNARLQFLNSALGSFQSLLTLLTPGQRAAYNRVAAGAQWPTLPPPVESPAEADAFARLRGKSIAIYTLTESAGRQAVAALGELVPDVRVELIHEHVASPRLVRLARTADVFVVAAASAKHAATDCITASRGERPLLYAPGRGFSGIVGVLERYALGLGPPDTVH